MKRRQFLAGIAAAVVAAPAALLMGKEVASPPSEEFHEYGDGSADKPFTIKLQLSDEQIDKIVQDTKEAILAENIVDLADRDIVSPQTALSKLLDENKSEGLMDIIWGPDLEYYAETGNPPSQYSDLYISPEALEDIKNWSVDEVDEVTRKEIYTNAYCMRIID